MKKSSKILPNSQVMADKMNELISVHNGLKSKSKKFSGHGRENPTHRRVSKFDQFISNLANVFGEANQNSILKQENYDSFKKTLEKSFAKKEKPELLDVLSTAIATSYRLKELLDLASKNQKILLSIVRDLHLQTAQSELNRKVKKNLKEEADEQRLKECLDSFQQGLMRKPTPTDFPAFVRTLKSKYPFPLYVKKPRLTKDERQLPKDEQEILLKTKLILIGKTEG